MSKKINPNSTQSDNHYWRPLDLNGDGKLDPEDDAIRAALLYQATHGGGSFAGPSRGCGTALIIILVIMIPIIFAAAVGAPSSGSGKNKASSYSSYRTKKSKTSESSSLSNEAKVTPRTDLDPEEYISGEFPAEGYYATKEALAAWTDYKDKAGDKKQYYRYCYYEFYPQYDFIQNYIIWLSDKGYIAHVNAAGKSRIPSVSKGRYTEVYDVTLYSTPEQFYNKYEHEFHGYSEAEQYYYLHDWIKPYVEKYGKSGAHYKTVKTCKNIQCRA